MFVSGASVTHGFIVHRVVRTPINKCSLQSCAGFAAGSSTRTSHGTEKTKSATDKIHVVSNHLTLFLETSRFAIHRSEFESSSDKVKNSKAEDLC